MPKTKVELPQKPIEIETLTPSQLKVINEVNRLIAAKERGLILWYGGVRAGKTVGSVKALIQHSLERSGKTYIIGAHTQRQVWTIIAPIVEKECNSRNIHYKAYRGNQDPRMEVGENLFYVFGGGDAGKDKAVQGMTASGLFLDELPNLNTDFVMQCEARTSDTGSLRIYTANKPDPYHWTTLYYFKRAEAGEIPAFLIDSSTAENQFLDASFLAERAGEYDDFYSARFLNNEFVQLNPPLYKPTLCEVPEWEPYLAVVATNGLRRVAIPVYKDGQNRIIGNHIELNDFQVKAPLIWLVPDTLPYLAKKLQKTYGKVRIVRETFNDRNLEITQEAFSGNLYLDQSNIELQNRIGQYVYRGSGCMFIQAIDALANYLWRVEKLI